MNNQGKTENNQFLWRNMFELFQIKNHCKIILTWNLLEHQVVSKNVPCYKSRAKSVWSLLAQFFKWKQSLTFNSPTNFSNAVSTGGLESITCNRSWFSLIYVYKIEIGGTTTMRSALEDLLFIVETSF